MSSAQFILIRGLLREARHWGDFSHQLQQQFPNVQIIALDLPGNGQLNHLTSPNTITGMTEALRTQIKVRKKLRLIALSMGGMIAIDWMMRYPQEIESAVVINTSARPISPFYQRLRWTTYLKLLKMLCHTAMQQEIDILALTSNKHSNNRAIIASWQEWRKQNPVSMKSAQNQCVAAAKFTINSPPRQLSRPLLVLTSKADHLVDYRCSIKLSKMLKADLIQHETAGHDLPLDEPEWVVDTIKLWLKGDR